MKTKCEVYSRVVGYIRPIDNMSDSKQAEVHDRIHFDSCFESDKQTVLKWFVKVVEKKYQLRDFVIIVILLMM